MPDCLSLGLCLTLGCFVGRSLLDVGPFLFEQEYDLVQSFSAVVVLGEQDAVLFDDLLYLLDLFLVVAVSDHQLVEVMSEKGSSADQLVLVVLTLQD